MNDDDGFLRNKTAPLNTTIKTSKKIVVHIPSLVILELEEPNKHTATDKIPSLLYPRSNPSRRTHYLPPLRIRQESTPNIDTTNLYADTSNSHTTFGEMSGNLNRSLRNNLMSQVFDQFKESKLKKSWLEMTANSICKKSANSSPKKLPSSPTQLIKLVTPRSIPKIDRFGFPRDSRASICQHMNTPN